MPGLSILLIIPLVTALLVLLGGNARQVRTAALTGAIVQLAATFLVSYRYILERQSGQTGSMLFVTRFSWFRPLNIEYYVGVDGISIVMLLLTAVVVLTGILISWNIEKMPKEFFLLLTLLSLGAYGFFISLDLFTMFFFLEFAVIPKFLLIAIWGSGRKEYSAMKLALMLMGGSALVLVGILATYYSAGLENGTPTFDLIQISTLHLPMEIQKVIFPLLFVGFGVFTALFPFHTWAPDGHSSAPTAGSMFLAGISMKLGGYGCLRVAAFLMPEAAKYYAWVIVLLATIAIVYGAFATLMQKDLKYMNAYSSVSHCGYVLLGIGMMNQTGINGAVLQMVSHGLMTALFFGSIGMLYERTHTRQIREMGGLLKVAPFVCVVYVIAGLCSLGLPGFSGFVAEMTVLMGAWENPEPFYRVATILSAAAIVVTAVYILQAAARTVMGPVVRDSYLKIKDATWNERAASVILIAAILVIGFTPFLITGLIDSGTGDITVQLSRSFLNR